MKFLLPFLAIAFLATSPDATAQGFPARAVRLIVADAAGGAPDQLGRILAQKLSEGLGQQVIVDNRPGAAGAIGADIAARSPADGYTLLLTTTSIYAILPSLKKNLPYVRRGRNARNRSPSWCSSRRANREFSTTPPPASARRPTSPAKCSICSRASS